MRAPFARSAAAPAPPLIQNQKDQKLKPKTDQARTLCPAARWRISGPLSFYGINALLTQHSASLAKGGALPATVMQYIAIASVKDSQITLGPIREDLPQTPG